MAEINSAQPINFLLSQEELFFILNLLNTQAIPGFEAETLASLDEGQRALVLQGAERALRARELSGRASTIRQALLEAVGVCAYSQSVALVYHWPVDQKTPVRYFGHIRENEVVAHSCPEEGLHLFTLLPAKTQLVDQILAVCQVKPTAGAPIPAFTLPGDLFVQVRQAAGARQTDEAAQLLNRHQVSAAAAAALVETLASSPRASVLQLLNQKEEGEVARQELTLLQNGHAWLLTTGETGTLNLKTVTGEAFRQLLIEAL